MISVTDLAFAYDETPVLTDISLTIPEGERLAIMGANGAGKSTLLKLLAGLYDPDAGVIERNDLVGFSPEDPTAGLFAPTVADEVGFFPKNRGLDVERQTTAALRTLDIYELRDRNPYSLSVGEQRRVAIAAVLAGDPGVVTLDEPTTGLDRHGEQNMVDRLEEVNATIVFSTHEADFAYALADRVGILIDGELARIGPTTDVLTDTVLLQDAGIRTPGIVTWARHRGLDHPPADFTEAVRMLEGER